MEGADALTACALTEVGRREVTTAGGRALYVEPSAVVELAGRTVLLGLPAWEWQDAGGGRWSRAARDTLVGALLGPPDAGLAQTPGLRRSRRALAVGLPSGRIGVLMETEPENTSREPSAARPSDDGFPVFHFAELDVSAGRARWGPVEEVPTRAERNLDLLGSPPLLAEADGSVVWVSHGFAVREPVMVVHRRTPDGTWSSHRVGDDLVEDVGLFRSADGRPAVLLAGPDSAFTDYRGTLRVVDADRPDGDTQLLVMGRVRDHFRWPRTLTGPEGRTVVTWILQSDDAPWTVWWAEIVLDAGGRWRASAPSRLGAEVPYTARASSPRAAYLIIQRYSELSGGSNLEVHQLEEASFRLVFSTANPFTGPMTAFIDDQDVLNVVGPKAEWHPVSPSVRSLMLRLSPSCAQEAAADHRSGRHLNFSRRYDAPSIHRTPDTPGPRGLGVSGRATARE